MLIFSGAHAYISSSSYEKEDVPTWNYLSVHVYGTIEVLEKEELLYSLNKLIEKHESHSEKPVKMSEYSEQTMQQLDGIVGFKIHILSIQAAKKLSQNKNATEKKNIVQQLEKRNLQTDLDTAQLMKKEMKK